MSIRVDPKYGLNPTMTNCIVCGEADAIIIGGVFKDKDGNKCQAPMYCGVVSVEPCPKCRKKYLEEAHGVLIVEAIRKQFPHSDSSKRWRGETEERTVPTGSIIILTAEAFTRIFTTPIPAKRICLMEPDAFAKLQPPDEKKHPL
jgi:hypothetical protein